ncbi:PREDICTED: A-kinase anchor protein 17A-like [Priapulus caudatus]|uniref:A-kinase anchor protein 17A-like n=1 Tax=Priapulus caudatus TaxID=37621 RepID=A0ABM1DWM1_PRICU|nr:PREDICTED: A-kinase anchor protein 17A-like [Priapulus caudatus]XP_014664343.1 PREDICTED: A-kinase anchor protein 17A-like [Priapulus caudatus]XP_014664344.1 PREDICTED: A-kinase anchor protein 17A-like [Priapulus caudatus]XP_014664345.1 PREDICTED: A-kinase anchor protein 17A-like [Priapulus caudatus]XP_014664346.1 PREDICTED: A-kinase anchor protein 17A-like [Priapulus caudatus]XP_014664347.1 PREDICTED: A-kinase anchor protein 17A-like [Priapulus caudatus]
MANAPTLCNDITEAQSLFPQQGLYLKPISKLNITVQMPQLKTPGKSISNWEVMEKLKEMVKPDPFNILKVTKSALEFVRFEAEMENKSVIPPVIARLDGKTMKLSGFTEQLKIRACESKVPFPSRHDWESFFRDAKNMNEMRPGERPDTIHMQGLPTKWFADRHKKLKDRPSDFILRQVFSTFGEVRCVDIPCLDPYRREITNLQGIQTFSFGQDLFFDAFVQYKEYVAFVRCMTVLRGQKMLFKDDDGKAYSANIKIDFDKTKHLGDKHIRKRRLEREKLDQLEKEREDRVRKEREEEERKKEEERRKKDEEEIEKAKKKKEKYDRKKFRQKTREEKRWQRKLTKKQEDEERKVMEKIAREERKILIAQRKLESIHLLTVLFERIKEIKIKEDLAQKVRECELERLRQIEEEKQRILDVEKRKEENLKLKQEVLKKKEEELRQKIMRNFKRKQEEQSDKEREELRRKIHGTTRLKSVLVSENNKCKKPKLKSVLASR